MRLNITAMSMASGLLWGTCLLIVAAANTIWPSYGQAFLQLCGSIFPGYRPRHRDGLGRYRDDLRVGGWRHRRSDLWVALQPFRGA
jgi:hypothetical protein